VEGYCDVEASKVEGFNEMVIQAAGAIAAGTSGHLLHISWETLVLAAWPLLILDVICVLLFKLWRVRRGTGYLSAIKQPSISIAASDIEAPLLDDIDSSTDSRASGRV
jgi:hypothetical protein